MSKILDGKAAAKIIRDGIALEVLAFEQEFAKKPGLAVIIVGDNAASSIYVNNKIRACEEAGIRSICHHLTSDSTKEKLFSCIDELNNDSCVHGVLVQLPLPAHLNEREILEKIKPEKDVDGFHVVNAGKLFLGQPSLRACTPSGVIELLKLNNISISGKHVVVVGRSNIVGKPAAMMFLQENATVTVCHSRTSNIKSFTKKADILVVAIGKSGFLTADMVKKGAVVVDVGINRLENGLCGDVDFEGVKNVASWITPVPGGVGPMTIAMLLSNTMQAATFLESERSKTV